jgi:hypothetical protein
MALQEGQGCRLQTRQSARHHQMKIPHNDGHKKRRYCGLFLILRDYLPPKIFGAKGFGN